MANELLVYHNWIYCKIQEALQRILLCKLRTDWTAATQLPLIYVFLPSMLCNWSFLEFVPYGILGVHKEVNLVGQEALWRSCFCRIIFVMWVPKHSPYAWPLCALIQCLTHPKTQESIWGCCFVFFLSLLHTPNPTSLSPPPFLRLRAWIPCAACLHLPGAQSTGVCPALLALKLLTYIISPPVIIFFPYRLLSLNFYTCSFHSFLYRAYWISLERLPFIKEFFFPPCWHFSFSYCARQSTQGS